MSDVGSINNVINAISPAITGRYLNISENDFQILFYLVLQQKRKKFWTKRNSQRKEGFIIRYFKNRTILSTFI